MLNFTNFRPVRSTLIHADGRTAMTKPIGAFCDYANTPENYQNSKFYFYFGVTILIGFFGNIYHISQEC